MTAPEGAKVKSFNARALRTTAERYGPSYLHRDDHDCHQRTDCCTLHSALPPTDGRMAGSVSLKAMLT